MKNILLLTDFSETSKNAIEYALQLFEKEVCNFYILYVQDSTTYTTDDLITNSSTSLYDSLISNHRKKLVAYVASLESEFKTTNFNFHTLVDFESLTEAINQTVKTKSIDFLVMGTNGATGAREVIFGSNTLNIIRKVNCTTLIIPQNFKYLTPKAILLALDPMDTLSGKAIRDFSNFFKHHNNALYVLRINPDNASNDLEPDDKLSLTHYLKSGNYTYTLIDEVPIEYAVETYLETNKIDILSLFVQKETFLDRLFIGSPTTKINKEVRLPLLIFHI